MAKSLFLLIIANLIGVVMNPLFLAATDTITVSGLDNARIVETIPEPEPEPVMAETTVLAPTAGAASKTSVVNVVPVNNIQIRGRTLEIIDVGGTEVDAGNRVNKYGEKLLYGHNTVGVFGILSSVGVGEVFTVNYGGGVRNYRVAEVVTYEKVSERQLSLNGKKYSMSAIANGRGQYDMVLMTCAGQSLGGGDATHRLVVFANAI